ncbi:hypothetical protein DQ04_10381000 [Trypanosoma grayi]|uniref:hypothetical protein n=1 Tax=Trypanosoma grayi TaxID=71804 RepID=UPI0004F48086|nr:hypothetical protein DQ04_10381000 [Trypanosoma grayi]KEG07262.1 hypothetical protein DQ04_10381000 [Trypanosoma grayi]
MPVASAVARWKGAELATSLWWSFGLGLVLFCSSNREHTPCVVKSCSLWLHLTFVCTEEYAQATCCALKQGSLTPLYKFEEITDVIRCLQTTIYPVPDAQYCSLTIGLNEGGKTTLKNKRRWGSHSLNAEDSTILKNGYRKGFLLGRKIGRQISVSVRTFGVYVNQLYVPFFGSYLLCVFFLLVADSNAFDNALKERKKKPSDRGETCRKVLLRRKRHILCAVVGVHNA